jgi:parallel beta-helix repeat protein
VVWSKVKPGTVFDVCFSETSSVLITGRGTATSPIVIQTAEGYQPTFLGSLVLYGASYVTVQNLDVRVHTGPAIILAAGSDHVVIQNNALTDSGHGIWISSAYGALGSGNLIMNNKISDNVGFGVAVDRDGVGAVIRGNQIYNNGWGGIELTGNSYRLEGNDIYGNGSTKSGTSGIHVFVGKKTDRYGKENIIRYNYVHDNHDETDQDGGGITLDQWCDKNQVYGNIVVGNDGAGIVLFDAASNMVHENTLRDNGVDSGNSHLKKANIALGTAGASTDRTVSNTVKNNSIVTIATIPGIYQDALTAVQPNTIIDNPPRLHLNRE